MNTSNKKFGLGKGISALLGDDDDVLLDDSKDVENFVKNTVFKDVDVITISRLI